MSNTIQLTAPRLVEVRSALQALKEKRLPSTEAETMVASIFQMLRPHFEVYDEVIKKIQKLAQESNDTEDAEEKKRLRKEVERMAEDLTDTVFEVRKPKTRLQAGHLPKAHKGKDGDENPVGNAGVMIALGVEFYEGIEMAPDTDLALVAD